MVEDISRFDIVLVKLNPTVGSEIQKTRPCIVISPNEMNVLKTIIVATMTSKGFNFIFRPKIKFEDKNGLILLDQLLKLVLLKKLAQLKKTNQKKYQKCLQKYLSIKVLY